MEQKKYGLLKLSNLNKSNTAIKPSIFGSDSDSDETGSQQKSVTSSSTVTRRQTQIDISRALTVDPNVFEYDSIYDEMKSKKESIVENVGQKIEKKPKYINNLLKYSENRKKEHERRVERKIQKERESEGNMFADKEAFVTNAYKEKLEEIRVAEENDLREQAIDELLDVKKQNDLSGFYRNLLNNNMSSDSTNAQTDTEQTLNQVSKLSKPKPIRQIRRRRSSSEESSDSLKDNDNQTQSNISQKANEEQKSSESQNQRHDSDNHSDSESEGSTHDDSSLHKSDANEEKEMDSNKMNENLDINPNEKSPKLDKRAILIKKFTKRTVGEVYDSAKLRYFERRDKYILN